MKTKRLILILFILTTVTVVAVNIIQSFGPHGGTIKQVENYNVEIKVAQSIFYAYLLDNKSKPLSNRGISCSVKFVFPDDIEVLKPLLPVGEDGFFIEAGSAEFSWCIVYFNVHGKPVSVKFENETLIAYKK